jgi:hypothetical protein
MTDARKRLLLKDIECEVVKGAFAEWLTERQVSYHDGQYESNYAKRMFARPEISLNHRIAPATFALWHGIWKSKESFWSNDRRRAGNAGGR